MSVIVAVKGYGCVYLAADSQATRGDSRQILDPAHGKLRQITPQLAVACTGSLIQIQGVARHITLNWKHDYWPPYRPADLEGMASALYSDIREGLVGLGSMEKNKDTGADELPGTLLIAWKDDFCIVDAGGALIKPAGDWWAIGSGADAANGSLHSSDVLYDNSDDGTGAAVLTPDHRSLLAVRAACRLNIYCSEPVVTAVTRP